MFYIPNRERSIPSPRPIGVEDRSGPTPLDSRSGRVSLLGRRVQARAATQPPVGEPLRERLDLRLEFTVLRILRRWLPPRRIVWPRSRSRGRRRYYESQGGCSLIIRAAPRKAISCSGPCCAGPCRRPGDLSEGTRARARRVEPACTQSTRRPDDHVPRRPRGVRARTGGVLPDRVPLRLRRGGHEPAIGHQDRCGRCTRAADAMKDCCSESDRESGDMRL